MGSQTLEILRQGVWASITGGFFYDPTANVFCNAVHLYLWLFLLCAPFITYLYFPITYTTWSIYCILTISIITSVKLINMALHKLYDKAQIVSDSNLRSTEKSSKDTQGEDDCGIEMQVLGNEVPSRTSADQPLNKLSEANSIISINEQVTSTIDLKVDVHRKNSSESSDNISIYPDVLQNTAVPPYRAENYQQPTSITLCSQIQSLPQNQQKQQCQIADPLNNTNVKQTSDICRRRYSDNTQQLDKNVKQEMPSQLSVPIFTDVTQPINNSSSNLISQKNTNNNKNNNVIKCHRHHHHHRNYSQGHEDIWKATPPSPSSSQPLPLPSNNNILNQSEFSRDKRSSSRPKLSKTRLERQNSLDTNEIMKHKLENTLVRQHTAYTSDAAPLEVTPDELEDSPLNENKRINKISKLQRHKSTEDERCTNRCRTHRTTLNTLGSSDMYLSSNNYTKSDLGIVELDPTDSTKLQNFLQNKRKDSNSTMSALQLPSTQKQQQQELKARRHSNVSSNPSGNITVRRIKSTALEISCPQPSVSNLSPHPNSVEAIQQQIKNPQNSLLPPPSKSLIRNQHFNLCSAKFGSNGDSVYHPIAEQADEKSLNDGYILKDLDSEDNYEDEENNNRTLRCSESGSDERIQRTQSTDSETDYNGSRSPLLSRENKPKLDCTIVKNLHRQRLENNEEHIGKGNGEPVGEQISMSSKDILLEIEKTSIQKDNLVEELPRGLNIAQEEADIENLRVKDAKSLGAIPKTNKRRSSDISHINNNCNVICQPIKRSVPKTMSRTSSSASSRSFSAESFSNDIYKTKDHYLFGSIAAAAASHGSGGQNNSLVGIVGHHHDYCGLPTNSGGFGVVYPRRTIVDGNYRFKFRNSRHHHPQDLDSTGKVEEISSSNFDFVLAEDLQKQQQEKSTTLSIQGLINDQYSFENSLAIEQRSTVSQILNSGTGSGMVISGGGGGDNTRSSGTHVEINESIYCEYWRPCSLSAEKPIQPKRFYRYNLNFFGGKHEFKVTMDRLQLLSLFDRDLHWFHVFLAIILSSLVSFLGSCILQLGFYRDIFAFVFCVVIAGSQYSLLKSVQPDAASPIHGFNKTVAYSRPIYFCICSGILLLCHHLTQQINTNGNGNDIDEIRKSIQLFGVNFDYAKVLVEITNFMSIILLLFPIFFSLGLFPQINTFCMYLLEQIDMHLFGGNAVCSLTSSILCILKSCLAISILYGPAYGGLIEQKSTQHFLFSFFCALLIPFAYHLSRSASDFSHLWAILKSSIANTYHEDDEEEDIKSTQAQPGGSSTKATTSSVSDEPDSNDVMKEQLEKNINKDNSKDEKELEHIGDSQAIESKTLSTESKLDLSEDKTDNVEMTTEETTSSNTNDVTETPDPLPKKLQHTVNSRLKNDLVVSTVLSVIVLSLHCSTIFTVLQPDLNIILSIIAGILGFLLHYVLPQMRKHMPWLCYSRPLLKQREFGQFEVSRAAKIMWFEGLFVYLCFLERNVLYPLMFISAMTADSQKIVEKFGLSFGALIVSICALKCVRNAYSDPANQYLIVTFSVLLFKVDFSYASETFLINYFLLSIIYRKTCDFLLKLQFIVTYIAPWQITWGSAFHAFAQPFSVPHSAMLFLQCAISSVLSTPLNPFLGSAIFLTSYVRPIKFWERDYNTRRIDNSNTRLQSQLERDLGSDDNNLNSIFYEHLTRSLQHSLCGDLMLGRWGNVNQGDCFVLASDYLNCLVHIIELGNGLCTFQMRGLEFRGTYCQQREVEAISEGVEDNEACCCCNPGHLPRMLSANAMFSTRWLAWQVIAAQYVLEGYSISENLATATLQVFEFRKVLITYYVKSIIYYVTKNAKLDKWLAAGPIQDSLQSTLGRQFVDLDPIFNYNLDEDFDFRALGITRSSFCSIYLSWIQFCYKKRKDSTTLVNLSANCANNNNSDNNNISKAEEVPTVVSPTNDISMNMNTIEKPLLKCPRTLVSTPANEINSNPSKNESNPLSPESAETEDCNRPPANEEVVTLTYSSEVPLRRARKKLNKRRLKFGGDSSPDIGSINQPDNTSSITKDSSLVSLCLALGLLARRSLASASHSSLSGVEFFLHGLHALFKGDFRITSARDEWVFADMELLHNVVAPAVKMALKLHQDHFSSPDEYLDPTVLYDAINTHSKELVISHEADPIWRSAVLRGAPNLLALRHVMEDGSDEYRIIRLTKRFLSFRVIKLNRECVRGLWAGQQQELIYLRNRNPERGSIQNAKQALRNIINSSCDQPIGYPIYVSPLTTSYQETSDPLKRIIGGPITIESIKQKLLDSWRKILDSCREGCSSGSAALECDIGGGSTSLGGGGILSGINSGGGFSEGPVVYFSPGTNTTGTLTYGSQSLSGTRGSLGSMNKPNSSTLLAGFLSREHQAGAPDILRENRSARKSTQRSSDRRATLPITSGGSRELMLKDGSTNSSNSALQKLDYSESNTAAADDGKTSTSSGNLGEYKFNKHNTAVGIESNFYKVTDFSNALSTTEDIGSPEEDTDEDDFDDFDLNNKEDSASNVHPLIDINKKVIIVDGMEIIYDGFERNRRFDVYWPNEKMRLNCGRSAWKDWYPQEGMVGYIKHYWQPNHFDARFQSNINLTIYLLEIGTRYLLIGSQGIREYNQIGQNESTIPAPNMKRSLILGALSSNTLKSLTTREYPSTSLNSSSCSTVINADNNIPIEKIDDTLSTKTKKNDVFTSNNQDVKIKLELTEDDDDDRDDVDVDNDENDNNEKSKQLNTELNDLSSAPVNITRYRKRNIHNKKFDKE